MGEKFDVAVIGGGPGGYVAAIRAAQLGKKVALVEKDKLGGLCLNWGCIPSKALLRSAEVYHIMQNAADFGFKVGDVEVDFDRVIKRSRDVADRLNKGVAFLMKKNKITTIFGTADLRLKGRVTVATSEGGEQTIAAENIIIATGGRHLSIPGVEVDHKKIINSSDAMILKKVPKSMVIIGGGAIGVEFAYFYNSLGTEVTIVEMLPQILPLEDEEVAKTLGLSFKKQGIKIKTGTRVESAAKTRSGVKLETSNAAGKETIDAELALMAVGFGGNTDGLGLEELGVETEHSFIKTDANYRTNVPGYYAIGDIIGPPLLAHVASAEGIVAAETIAGLTPKPVDYENIPNCTYCQPQVASVGLTEKKAREAGYEVKVGKFPFRALGKAIAVGETDGFVKLIFEAEYGELLGAHIICSDATDLIAELATARTLETTAHELIKTVHAHPTFTEAVMEAAADAFGEAIHI